LARKLQEFLNISPCDFWIAFFRLNFNQNINFFID
jgi:hypothetical protein